jgi:hypothetical protein
MSEGGKSFAQDHPKAATALGKAINTGGTEMIIQVEALVKLAGGDYTQLMHLDSQAVTSLMAGKYEEAL